MKIFLTSALALTLAAGVAFTQDKGKGGGPGGKGGGKAKGPGLTLTTTAFQDGAMIPEKYTQAAGPAAVSPALTWTNVPMGTQSFVLHMHDPDVAIGGNTASRTYTGTIANLNAYFAAGNATITPGGGFSSGTLSITINDQGNTGTGGAKSASVSVNLEGVLFANGFE